MVLLLHPLRWSIWSMDFSNIEPFYFHWVFFFFVFKYPAGINLLILGFFAFFVQKWYCQWFSFSLWFSSLWCWVYQISFYFALWFGSCRACQQWFQFQLDTEILDVRGPRLAPGHWEGCRTHTEPGSRCSPRGGGLCSRPHSSPLSLLRSPRDRSGQGKVSTWVEWEAIS